MLMGTEGPLLTIYESGKVIFRNDREFKIIEFDKEERNDLISEMNLSDT